MSVNCLFCLMLLVLYCLCPLCEYLFCNRLRDFTIHYAECGLIMANPGVPDVQMLVRPILCKCRPIANITSRSKVDK